MKTMKDRNGMTILEILISTAVISVVFMACIGVYTTALKVMGTAQSGSNLDITRQALVQMSKITKRVQVSHQCITPVAAAGSSSANSPNLTVRANYSIASGCNNFTTLGNPMDDYNNTTSDDRYWHYRFIAGTLRMACNAASNYNVNATDTLLIDNVNVANSWFKVTNPTSVAGSTVIQIHVETTSPATVVETSAMLVRAKR